MTHIPGQPLDLRARDWDDLLAMLQWWKQGGRQLRGKGGWNTKGGLGGGGNHLGRVLMRNDTGNDVPLFGCLAMQEPVVTDAENFATERFAVPVFKGIVPTSSYWGKWAVLQEPAPYESGNPTPVYWGVCSGPTWCNVNIVDDQDVAVEHDNSTQELRTGMHGSARILWKESGTGTGKIARILMGDWVTDMLCKTNSSHAKGASQAVSVWLPDGSADTLVDVTATNRAGNIGASKWCGVRSYLGNLVIVWAECP